MTTTPVHSITDEQIAEIEALAKKATQGIWEYCKGDDDPESEWSCQFPTVASEDGEIIGTEGFYSDKARDEANAAHVAASCPSVVIALITRLREAEKDSARMEWLANAGDLIVNLERWKDLENGRHNQSARLSLSNGKLYAGKTLRETIDTAMQGDK